MKKIFSIAILCGCVLAANAVPAKRGWQTRTQADGTTIEVQQFGDEYYHYLLNRDGQEVRLNEAGMYEVVGEAPTPNKVRARHTDGKMRRQRQDVGTQPNLAPKGVVILVNFSDSRMKSAHTSSVFDELCNSTNCTVNNGYPSAAQYFADQSNGAYRPQFDVFGPVTVSKNTAYYGGNEVWEDEYGEEQSQDSLPTDAVIEACQLVTQQFPIQWSNYDSNNDGKVDFVYVIYAGKGEADGGSANTIWPHNYSVMEAVTKWSYNERTGEWYEDPINGVADSKYEKSDCIFQGLYIDNYAMSSELEGGGTMGGIGTLCHEFGHVIGLPDLYDIEYGSVYQNSVTPADWNIMDAGSYNAGGHCPPNYDPWEKSFFGWHTPINPGNQPQTLTLKANGTEGYQAYQINASGKLQGPTTAGLCYYIENRQKQGWDAPLTGHGLLIWKVNFNENAWVSNAPNASSTSGAPLYTVVSATGTKIGWDGETDNCAKNTFPGSGKKTSWSGVSGKPLKDIKESNGVITLTYIDNASSYVVSWFVNGEQVATREYNLDGSEDLVVPTNVEACEGTEFIGWTTEANWCDPLSEPADLNPAPSGKVTNNATYYALFE